MLTYIIKRLLLIVPTLFAIIVINFFIVQGAPGGPVENLIARLKSPHGAGGEVGQASANISGNYMASQGLDPDMIASIKKLYGFDKPIHERFWLMIKNYATFDLGESYFKNAKVTDLIIEKLPISISLGLWSTLLIYLIAIPLGIRKAVKDGQVFDTWSSFVIIIAYAIPSFILAICLIMIFAGNGHMGYFPIRGIISYNWEGLTIFGKIKDYFWHMVLPTIALTISGFATIAMLTKNSFLEEIHKQYVLTARAKGLTENNILYGHVFRNAMLLVISGIPDAFIKILFTSALLIEIVFSLDGLGLLGYEAAIGRDYPVVFGSLYIYTLIGLLINLITDLTYVLIDPRINFEKS